MGMIADPELLKLAAETIKTQGLDMSPTDWLRPRLEKKRDEWLAQFETGNAPASNPPSAAVAAYRAKLSNGSS